MGTRHRRPEGVAEGRRKPMRAVKEEETPSENGAVLGQAPGAETFANGF